ncbi:MAG: glucose 1-dehydrogenase [Chloroflexi bacterium]|nr:glucose 1-dehydrogenase [Chloroflexota bacterium]
MQLVDKIAIVTGAASGIGRAIARGLAREGARVVIADIFPEGAERMALEIEAEGGKALAIKVDVSQNSEVEAMVAQTLRQFATIDILVNDAGIFTRVPVAEMTEEEWDQVLDVNLKGVFLCSRAVIKHMIPRRYGKIVNVASSRGIHGSARGAHYAASKGGIIAFTRSLALEMAPYSINVNAIAPGATDTPLWRAGRTPEELEPVLRSGQVGQPEDLVGGVIFLASDASRLITGHTIIRDIFMPR